MGITQQADVCKNSTGVILNDSFVRHNPTMTPSRQLQAWVVCLTAGLFFFYEFFQLNIFDVINPALQSDFGLNAGQLSLMSSSFVWANVLFLLPAGFVLDHYPIKSVILVMMAWCVVGTLGFALSYSFLWATVFHALTGVGNAFCFLSCVVLVARWFAPEQQALVIGCIVTMAFLGGTVAHTPFATLTAAWGWRNAMLMSALLGAMIFLLLAVLVHNPAHYRPIKSHRQAWWPSLKHAMGYAGNWLAGGYTACLNLPIMVLCALWGGSYLRVVHHLPPLLASNVVSLIFIGSILGCPLMGWLSDKQGQRKPIMIAGAVLTGITLLPLYLPWPLSNFELSLIFFGLGLFTSAQVLSYPLIAASNPPSQTGFATGLASVIVMGGAGLAQMLFGYLIAWHSGLLTVRAADFHYAFWMFPITTLLALLASLTIQEKKYNPRQ